jgi:hypothetical protein
VDDVRPHPIVTRRHAPACNHASDGFAPPPRFDRQNKARMRNDGDEGCEKAGDSAEGATSTGILQAL